MTKIKTSEDNFKLGYQLHNSCIETDSNFKIQNAKFNVIHSSEISKVLRELTQCIANDQDLFSNNDNKSEQNTENKSNKSQLENDNILIKKENVEILTSEISSSTSNTTSTDLSLTQTNKIGGDKHICLQCGKQFSKRDFLQKHKIVHEIPRHKCMACEKSFVREDKLKRHFTSIHSKHRPHICDVCSKAFARKDKLKDHQKHHLTAGNSFQCTDCQVPFVQKSDLNRHFRGVHKGEAGVGINIPSKGFTKSKINDTITKKVSCSVADHFNQSLTESIQSSCTKNMVVPNSFYPMQTSMLPVNSNNAHLTQINTISDLSKSLIKPNISFIPALPLKVEFNYSAPNTLPRPKSREKSTVNSLEKENLQVKFKSKRSFNKSKYKSNSYQSCSVEESKNIEANKFSFSNCKNDPLPSSTSSINCLVSQSATLYPHIPIITPFQSPMISVFPSAAEFYSRTLTSSAKHTSDTASLVNSSSTIPGYNRSVSIDPLISSGLSSSNNNIITSNIAVKPTYSLGTNNITFAHQNLYQFQQNQLRYYSYLQPGSHFFGQHSTRPLTANIYPYMPF